MTNPWPFTHNGKVVEPPDWAVYWQCGCGARAVIEDLRCPSGHDRTEAEFYGGQLFYKEKEHD